MEVIQFLVSITIMYLFTRLNLKNKNGTLHCSKGFFPEKEISAMHFEAIYSKRFTPKLSPLIYSLFKIFFQEHTFLKSSMMVHFCNFLRVFIPNIKTTQVVTKDLPEQIFPHGLTNVR